MSKFRIAASTPVVTSGSAYANGNVVGTQLTFLNLQDGGYSVIYSASLIDQSGQNIPIDLFIFNAPLTSAITDKTAVALNAADLRACVGVISIAAVDYAAAGTGSVAAKAGKANLFIGVAGGPDDNCYGLLVARGAGTYTSTSAITVNIVAEQSFINQ